MNLEGNWWLLQEEEPFNEETTPQLRIEAGAAVMGERRGTWSQTQDRFEVVFPAIGERVEQRYYFGVTQDPNMLSGTLYEVFGELPAGFVAGKSSVPDDVFTYPVTLSRVEPLSADVIEMNFGVRG